MPLAGQFAFPLGGSPQWISPDQAFDLLVQLLPVGAAKLYGLVGKTGDVYNYLASVSDSLKAFCYDYIAQLRSEVSPLSAAYKLPDYEAACGLSQTPTALSGTTQARRAQVVSRLREQGAFTVSNVQAILAPLLGYSNASQLQVVECNRAALTAAHTYANSMGMVVGPNSSASQSVNVLDDGGVGDAGVQFLVTLTCANPEQLSFSLTGPSVSMQGVGSGQYTYQFAAGSLPSGAVAAVQFQLNDLVVAPGKVISGPWTLTVNTGSAPCTVSSWQLFVEGGSTSVSATGRTLSSGGRDGWTGQARDMSVTSGAIGNSGLGMQVYDWLVVYDSTKSTSVADFAAARAAISRITPAFATGYLVQNPTTANASPTLYPPFMCQNQ